jgi:hypothetical protein
MPCTKATHGPSGGHCPATVGQLRSKREVPDANTLRSWRISRHHTTTVDRQQRPHRPSRVAAPPRPWTPLPRRARKKAGRSNRHRGAPDVDNSARRPGSRFQRTASATCERVLMRRSAVQFPGPAPSVAPNPPNSDVVVRWPIQFESKGTGQIHDVIVLVDHWSLWERI